MERYERGTYLGGQQIAAVMGLHPYMSIGDVFARAVWKEDNVDPDAPAIRRGRILEPGLLDEAMRIDDIDPRRFVRDHFAVDDGVDFFAGTIDGVTLDEHGFVDTIYEVTTSSKYGSKLWGISGSEDAAHYKWVQSQWYMGILGARRARIFCLFVDDDDLREYTVPRAEGAIREMRGIGEEFWLDHVLVRDPPSPDKFGLSAKTSPEDVSEVMNRLYRAAPDGLEINATDELIAARAEYIAAREAERLAKERKAAAQVVIKSTMRDATLVRFDDGSIHGRSRAR